MRDTKIDEVEVTVKKKNKNKVGRKALPKKLKKDRSIMSNFTDEEYVALEQEAKKQERSISSMVRMAALATIKT